MTNRELINELMNHPLDAEIAIDCECCAHGTVFASGAKPKITCSGGTFKTLTIRTNHGFENESLHIDNVTDDSLLKELGKRMKND